MYHYIQYIMCTHVYDKSPVKSSTKTPQRFRCVPAVWQRPSELPGLPAARSCLPARLSAARQGGISQEKVRSGWNLDGIYHSTIWIMDNLWIFWWIIYGFFSGWMESISFHILLFYHSEKLMNHLQDIDILFRYGYDTIKEG